MLKVSGLLAAGALLLSFGSMSASALPTSGTRVAAPPTSIDLVEYGSQHCFNRCVAGRMFRRCQLEPDQGQMVSCCSTRCNWFY
jgi:hypothetical protein